MTDLLDTQLYGLIGEDGFHRLVAAFYRRVPGDDVLGPMYPPNDLPAAERRLADFLIQRFGGPVPLPDFWGGYRVIPSRVEFWQGRPSRLHDRLLYARDGGLWSIQRLSP